MIFCYEFRSSRTLIYSWGMCSMRGHGLMRMCISYRLYPKNIYSTWTKKKSTTAGSNSNFTYVKSAMTTHWSKSSKCVRLSWNSSTSHTKSCTCLRCMRKTSTIKWRSLRGISARRWSTMTMWLFMSSSYLDRGLRSGPLIRDLVILLRWIRYV